MSWVYKTHGYIGMGLLGVGWGLILDTHAKPIPIWWVPWVWWVYIADSS